MSRCRSTSFYLAPGVLKYFKDHTLAIYYNGELYPVLHRSDIAAFLEAHPDWDGVVLLGAPGGIDVLRRQIEHSPEQVEIWRTDTRTIEGRRPRDAAAYVLHKWAVSGDLDAVGGARELVSCIAPTAPKSVRKALEAASAQGSMHAVQVVSAAWRAGLLTNPDLACQLIEQFQMELAVAPDAKLEPLLASLAASGRQVDVASFLSSVLNASIDAGAATILSQDPATPPGVLAWLATQEEHYFSVAANPSTPPEVLARLVEHGDGSVLYNASRNPSTPPEVLARLAKDKDESVRAYAAANPSMPPELLTLLAGDDYESVLCAVAANPATPPEVLTRLAEKVFVDSFYDTEYVRYAVAANPSTPPELLTHLAERGDWEVRSAAAANVAANPSTPPELLTRLADDEEFTVREEVAMNLSTPPDVLTQIALHNPEMYLRAQAAGNSSMPVDVLEQLANDSSNYLTKVAVAHNPSTPVESVVLLTKDRRFEVSMAALQNPNCPFEVVLASGHSDVIQHRMVLEGRPLMINSTADMVYDTLVQLGATAPLDVPGKITHVKQIGARSLPFKFGKDTRELKQALHNETVVVDGTVLQPRVIESPDQLTHNANYMGNCTEGYLSALQGDEKLIVALDDASGATLFNVEILRDFQGQWREVDEINTRFNQGVSEEQASTIRAMVNNVLNSLKA